MYRARVCSSSGGQIVLLQHLVSSLKRPFSTPVESGLQSVLNRRTVWPLTESDDTRCCNNTIRPPEDEHSTARNMSRIKM